MTALIVALGAAIAEWVLVEQRAHAASWGSEVVFVVAVYFVVGAALVLAPRRGLAVLWLILGLFWVASMVSDAVDIHSFVGLTSRLPRRFLAWSIFGIPLFIATKIHRPGAGAIQRRHAQAWLLIWLLLLVPTYYFSTFATDAGIRPFDGPAFEVFCLAILLCTPVLVSAYCAWRYRDLSLGLLMRDHEIRS